METKRIFKFFTMFEYEKEQEFLRSMHRSGWKLAKISGICLYHFEKCIPEDVVYQLDYNTFGMSCTFDWPEALEILKEILYDGTYEAYDAEAAYAESGT